MHVQGSRYRICYGLLLPIGMQQVRGYGAAFMTVIPESNLNPTSHIPQFRERENRIVNTRDQADEELADEEPAAPAPGCASVNPCGCARDQCPQNSGKSSAS